MKVYLAYVGDAEDHNGYVDAVFYDKEKAIQHLISKKYCHWWYKDKNISDQDKRMNVIHNVVEMEVK